MLLKVVDMFKTYQPSTFKQLNVAKREKIVELMSQDARNLFDLPVLSTERNAIGLAVPDIHRSGNPVIQNKLAVGLFSHLNR